MQVSNRCVVLNCKSWAGPQTFPLPGTLHKVAQADLPWSNWSAMGPFQHEIIGKYNSDPERKKRNGHLPPKLKGKWLTADLRLCFCLV